MPTQSEKVVNRPLSGVELREYLRSVFNKILENEGMLSPHVAFGHIAGSIKLTLNMDNAFFPQSITSIEFKHEGEIPPGTKIEQVHDESEKEAEWDMDNPNAERVRLGMPVPVETKQLDGTKQIEHIIYPKDDVEDLPPQKVKVKTIPKVAT